MELASSCPYLARFIILVMLQYKFPQNHSTAKENTLVGDGNEAVQLEKRSLHVVVRSGVRGYVAGNSHDSAAETATQRHNLPFRIGWSAKFPFGLARGLALVWMITTAKGFRK
jgi:hypothetical protein